MRHLRTLGAIAGATLLATVPTAQGSNSCASATPIAGEGAFNFNSAAATTDGPSACGLMGHDIWFAWTAPATDAFTFDTCTGTGFDSVLAAYDGTSCPATTQLSCNDDTCGLQSEISFAATAGNEYLIRIGSYNNGPGGSGTLTVVQGGVVTDCFDPAPGPDVIVGSLSDVGNYGATGGVSAFSLGTTSCNVGTAELNWIAGNNQHPVIAQNIYRYEDGRFEQLGLSWLKHGFTALQGDLCCDCTPSGTGSRLGVGCSDPYGAGLNGSQSGLGPRFEVNAHTGDFSYPYTAQGQSGNVLYKRIQVPNDELDPALHPTALFYGEGQYIALDDAQAGNGNNNASYRQLIVTNASGGSVSMTVTGPTFREDPAIRAWQANQPSVQIEEAQVPDEGLFLVASHATDNGDGTWHYEYAVQNLNSDVSAASFKVPVPASVDVTNIDFHDVDHHSGEPHEGTDWPGSEVGDTVTWTTDRFSINPDANAIRWGTMYNFRFDADVPPSSGTVTLGLFKPHTPSQLAVPASVPGCNTPVAASESVRAGSPANPTALLPGQTSPPIAGAVWDPVIDHSSFFTGATGDFLAIAIDGVQANTPSPIGTILCNLPATAIFFSAGPGTPFSVGIPESCDLIGLGMCTQGGSFDGVTIELANALDIVIGSL